MAGVPSRVPFLDHAWYLSVGKARYARPATVLLPRSKRDRLYLGFDPRSLPVISAANDMTYFDETAVSRRRLSAEVTNSGSLLKS